MATVPDRGPGRTGARLVDHLLALAHERFRLVVGDDGRPYAAAHAGPPVALPIASRGPHSLRQALAVLAFEARGVAPSGGALATAVGTLAMEAEATGEPVTMAMRSARTAAGAVVDLGTRDGFVEIGPAGWHVTERPAAPVLFLRSVLAGPLPRPELGGSLDELRELANLARPMTWPVVVAWLAAVLAGVTVPALALVGPGGAGKTTAARQLAGLVDPSPAPLRQRPRNLRQWSVTAPASWVVGLDDTGPVSPWLAHVLSRAAGGDAIAVRSRTDELSVLAPRQAVLLTARSLGPVPPDLARRLLSVRMDRPRPGRPEDDVLSAYRSARPRLLGALCDVVAGALAVLPDVPADRSRSTDLSDFSRFAAAVHAAR